MRMKKWIVMMIVLMLAAVCLAGCGRNENKTGGSDTARPAQGENGGAAGEPTGSEPDGAEADQGQSDDLPIYDVAACQTVGNIVTFGHYEQDNNRVNGPEPIEWVVLDVQGNKALLLSKYALDSMPYHAVSESVTWEKCTLRSWLNNEFLSAAFNEKEQSVILMTNVDNSDASRHSNALYTATGGNDTEDRVFLLSYHEVFRQYFSDDKARICAPTDHAIANGAWINDSYQAYGRYTGKWWLRSPGSWESQASDVDYYGVFDYWNVKTDSLCVRPALWISLGTGITGDNGSQSEGSDAGISDPDPEMPGSGDDNSVVPSDTALSGGTAEPVASKGQSGETAPDASDEDGSESETDDYSSGWTNGQQSGPETERPATDGTGNNHTDRGPSNTATERPATEENRNNTDDREPSDHTTELPVTEANRDGMDEREPSDHTTELPATEENRDGNSDREPSDDTSEEPGTDENRSSDADRVMLRSDVSTYRTVTFGHYEQDNNPDNGPEPIEWLVLEEQEGKALLLCRYALDTRPFNTEDYEGLKWEDCSVRTWLNSDFLNTAFNEAEQKAILLTEVNNSDSLEHPGWEQYETEEGFDVLDVPVVAGNKTQDFVFLLSTHEVYDLFFPDPDYRARFCYPTDSLLAKLRQETGRRMWYGTECWWLRTTTEDGLVGFVLDDDRYDEYTGATNGTVVRPALWVSLDDGMIHPGDEIQPDTDSPDEATDDGIHVGSIVAYGSYEQDNIPDNGPEPIEWLVLDVQDGKALLLSRYGLETRPYNAEEQAGITWEECSLRAWLNHDFMNTAFSGEEQMAILLTDVNNSDSLECGIHIGDYIDIPAIGGNDTRDYVFVLSCREAISGFRAGTITDCVATEYVIANAEDQYISWEPPTADWWVRTTIEDGEAGFAYNSFGGFNPVTDSRTVVRPAMWLSLESADVKIVYSDPVPPDSNPDSSSFGTVGNVVTFGRYEQDNHEENGREPIEWIVLDMQDGKALLVSRYGLDTLPFNREERTDITWEDCSLRTWLNSDFLNAAFSGEEQKAILLSDVNNNDSSGYSGWLPYDENGIDYEMEIHVAGGNNTQDYVFILSGYEVFERYFRNDQARMCTPTDYSLAKNNELYPTELDDGQKVVCWWLRLTLVDGSAGSVIEDGSSYYFTEGNWNGSVIRPALWIDLESGIF